MDRVERKARALTKARNNRICDTCRHKQESGCEVTPDKNTCVYGDYSLWKPSTAVFNELAEHVLQEWN